MNLGSDYLRADPKEFPFEKKKNYSLSVAVQASLVKFLFTIV